MNSGPIAALMRPAHCFIQLKLKCYVKSDAVQFNRSNQKDATSVSARCDQLRLLKCVANYV